MESRFRAIRETLPARMLKTLLGGSQSDLEQAAVAVSMVGSLGLAGRMQLLYFAGADKTSELLSFPEVLTSANAELSKADKAARSLLSSNRAASNAVAAVLMGARPYRWRGGCAHCGIISRRRPSDAAVFRPPL
jgi:hypothetical protein